MPGIELAVIAPDSNRSATARSITTRKPLWVDEIEFGDGTTGYATDGTPVDCVRFAALGLVESVRFVGPQPQSVLPLYYAAADVTVLPSYYESFGMVALEAMACGSPVIASRVGGLVTTVRDGVTGFLVPDGDVEALAERIETLVGDPELRWRLGREGVRWAAQHRWPCVAEAVCKEYASLESRAGAHLAAGRCRD